MPARVTYCTCNTRAAGACGASRVLLCGFLAYGVCRVCVCVGGGWWPRWHPSARGCRAFGIYSLYSLNALLTRALWTYFCFVFSAYRNMQCRVEVCTVRRLNCALCLVVYAANSFSVQC